MSRMNALPRFLRTLATALALAVLVSGSSAHGEDPPLPVEYLAHVRQGREHLSIRNTFRALAEFQMALRIHAEDVAAWDGLARAGWMSGDEDVTLLALLRAIELAPERADYRRMLGDVHARTGRRLAAAHAYLEARRCAAAGDALDPDIATRIDAWLEKSARSDPAIEEKARAAAAGPGLPVRLVCRYFSQAPADGSMRREGSVPQGERLDPRVLRAVAFDAHGFPIETPRGWAVSNGLKIEAAGDPPTIRAIDRAWNAKLTVAVEGAGSPLMVTVPLQVIGPVTRISVRPPKAQVQAGERVHFLVAALDDAGHRLWLPEVRWSLETAEPQSPGRMRREMTTQPPEHFFEPHRNIVEIDAKTPPREGSTFKVIAREPSGKVLGAAACEVVPGTAGGADRPGGISWRASYEEAVAAARAERKPLMVEFTAEW